MSRKKGKHWELWFINSGLKDLFKDIERNPYKQEKEGGVDLVNTGCFNFECKGGKTYKIAKIRKMLDQVRKEGEDKNLDCVLVKPTHEDPFVVMPYKDFLEVLWMLKVEGVL